MNPGQELAKHPLAGKTYMGERFAYWGSDKSTNHAYDPIYEKLFPPEKRDQVRSVFEIGIAEGQGLLAFHDIFPNAQIVGLDPRPVHNQYAGSTDPNIYPLTPRPDRMEIHQGDMRSRDDLMRAVNGRQFDLIVEDATHILDDNLRTLFWLWPFVAQGGLYVIEEMESVQSWVENLQLFTGFQLHRTEARGNAPGGEILVVIKKE